MNQLTLFEAAVIGAPHNGTSTSIAAAKAAGPKVGTHKREIYDLLLTGSMTQDEVSLALYMPRSTVCARMNEMEHEGLIHKTNDVRPTQYGRMAVVYQLAKRGTS